MTQSLAYTGIEFELLNLETLPALPDEAELGYLAEIDLENPGEGKQKRNFKIVDVKFFTNYVKKCLIPTNRKRTLLVVALIKSLLLSL